MRESIINAKQETHDEGVQRKQKGGSLSINIGYLVTNHVHISQSHQKESWSLYVDGEDATCITMGLAFKDL